MKKIYLSLLSMMLVGACTTLPTSTEYVTRADGYFYDGQPQKAIDAYNRALKKNPHNLQAYASRGAAHFFAGQLELAQQDFEHVLQENPYHADTYTAYGSVLAARGDFQSALQVLEIAIRLSPDKVENYFSRAGIYFMLEQYDQAINDYTRVLQTHPAAEVFNARGAAYLRLNRNDLAEQDFQTAQNERLPATLSVYSKMK